MNRQQNMNPAPGANAAPDTDAMDLLLRDPAHREPYVEDGGFTAAVMARIPAPVNYAWRRWILLASGLVAALFGLLAFDGAVFIWRAALDVAKLRGFSHAQFSLLAFALVFYWTLYAVVRAEQE